MIGYGVVGTENQILPKFFTYTGITGEDLIQQKRHFRIKYLPPGLSIDDLGSQFPGPAVDVWNDVSDFSIIPLGDASWFIGVPFYLNKTLDRVSGLGDLITPTMQQKMDLHCKKMGLTNPTFYLASKDFTKCVSPNRFEDIVVQTRPLSPSFFAGLSPSN